MRSRPFHFPGGGDGRTNWLCKKIQNWLRAVRDQDQCQTHAHLSDANDAKGEPAFPSREVGIIRVPTFRKTQIVNLAGPRRCRARDVGSPYNALTIFSLQKDLEIQCRQTIKSSTSSVSRDWVIEMRSWFRTTTLAVYNVSRRDQGKRRNHGLRRKIHVTASETWEKL